MNPKTTIIFSTLTVAAAIALLFASYPILGNQQATPVTLVIFTRVASQVIPTSVATQAMRATHTLQAMSATHTLQDDSSGFWPSLVGTTTIRNDLP